MKINYLLLGFMLLFLISFVSAEDCSISPVKQGNCIQLTQTCTDCSFVNITKIQYPDKSIITLNIPMTKTSPVDYNYTSCDTNNLGTHYYTSFGDPSGTLTSQTCSYDVTTTGLTGTLGFYIVFLIIIVGVFVLGYMTKNNYIMMLGSLLILFFGFFIISYGIDILKSTQTTWAVGIISWAVGIICIYISLEEQLKEWG